MEDCFKAINEGRADYTYANSYTAPYYLNTSAGSDLLTLPMTLQSTETAFGMVRPVEPELLLVINKSLRSLPAEQMDSIAYDNALIDQDEQLGIFMRDHLVELAVGAIIILMIIIVLLVLYLRARLKAAQRFRTENQRYQKLYSLANEQFFEYQLGSDTLIVGRPKNGEGSRPDAGYVSGDEDTPYVVYRNARSLIEARAEQKLFDALTSPQETVTELLYRPEQGAPRWIRITSQVVTDNAGRAISVIGKITNIDNEVCQRQELAKRAHHDGLTDLLNWETFQERVTAMLAEGRAYALLIVDTDNFKNVNDTYGHMVGDVALQRTAEALRGAFRSHDLIGRLGGDEFAICVNGPIDHDKLVQRCADIVESSVTFPDQDGTDRVVTLSVGGVELHGASVPYGIAYRQADRCLYRAKAEGRHRFIVEPIESPEDAETNEEA